MNKLDAVDLFAGPGGWDIAARELGLDVLGIEWDGNACATREAAGLRTVQGDVRSWDAADWPATGLIASPPCPTFSTAGKGSGRRALDSVIAAAWHMAACGGLLAYAIDDLDERTGLVLEPLRWIMHARDDGTPYEWVALEQVPTVRPVWDAYAEILRGWGYDACSATLNAEQYGVPQTRKRAILIARLGAPVKMPTPTHSRYYPRTPERLDPGVARWVTMADALAWDGDVTVRSNYGTGGDSSDRRVCTADQPASTVTSKAGRNAVIVNSNRPNAAVRPIGYPAPTMHFGARTSGARWVIDRPAPTVTGGGTSTGGAEPFGHGARKSIARWVNERPATTVQGDPRLAAPGRREFVQGGPSMFSGESARLTVEEAGVLQTFPLGYPWQGTKSQQFQQIGNAIPPLLALHVLSAVTGLAIARDGAA